MVIPAPSAVLEAGPIVARWPDGTSTSATFAIYATIATVGVVAANSLFELLWIAAVVRVRPVSQWL